MIDPFEIYQKIHFIGIGGIGISALARLLKHKNHQISGSDQIQTHNSDLLIEEGIKVVFNQSKNSLPTDAQLIIHTTAIPADNPELIEANKRKIPIFTYPQAIGKLTDTMETLSVCGTHGKTTITAMLGLGLISLQKDPTVIVGSLVKSLNNSNLSIGKSKLLILESCEYQEAFLNYNPKIILINNIDPEHMDYFHTAENYLNAFRKFIKKLPKGGILIANGDDQNVRLLLQEATPELEIITFGTKVSNDFQLIGNKVKTPQEQEIQLNLKVPGDHNLLNATACIATCQALNIDPLSIVPYLENFDGTARRLELKGKIKGLPVIDDYGHTPTEIRATLQALKSKYGKNSRILCIFQPHQYSRTYYFLDEFSKSFNDASKVLIPNIYRSRDSAEDIAKINVDMLVKAINCHQADSAINTLDFPNTLETLKTYLKDIDVIITMGAGDINCISSDILDKFS